MLNILLIQYENVEIRKINNNEYRGFDVSKFNKNVVFIKTRFNSIPNVDEAIHYLNYQYFVPN